MTKTIFAALMLTIAAPAFAAEPTAADMGATAPVAAKGKMLMAADGARLAPVYRVDAEGPQIILDGHMVTVPGNTLKMVDGKLTTSLNKRQVIALQ